MAAAAAVMLSTLAVMMAVRTEHEMPTFTPPPVATSRGPRRHEYSCARVEPGSASDKSAADAAVANDAACTLAGQGARRVTDRRRARGSPANEHYAAKDEVAPQLSDSKVTAPIGEPRAKEEVQDPCARLASASAAAPLEAKRAAPSAAAGSEVGVRGTGRAGRGPRARRDEGAATWRARPARQAPAVTGALGAAAEKPRAEGDVAANELRAEDWLEKIIKLRQTGRHEEADAELKRFRERYPHVQVPAAALPPSGTR